MSPRTPAFFLLFSALFFSCVPSPSYSAGAPLGAYVVQAGDCLWKIAAKRAVYGNPWRWPLIYNANTRIADPELIQPGWRLDYPLLPSVEDVLLAAEEARQYEGPAEAAPPVPPMALADVRVMDDSLPAQKTVLPPGLGAKDPWIAMLVLGVLVFTGLLILAYSLVPLFLAWTRTEEPVLKMDQAGEGPMAETSIAVPEEPAEAPLPQPTESEAIVRAMEGPDPDEGVMLKPLEAKDLEVEKKAEEGEVKEEEKMAA